MGCERAFPPPFCPPPPPGPGPKTDIARPRVRWPQRDPEATGRPPERSPGLPRPPIARERLEPKPLPASRTTLPLAVGRPPQSLPDQTRSAARAKDLLKRRGALPCTNRRAEKEGSQARARAGGAGPGTTPEWQPKRRSLRASERPGNGSGGCGQRDRDRQRGRVIGGARQEGGRARRNERKKDDAGSGGLEPTAEAGGALGFGGVTGEDAQLARARACRPGGSRLPSCSRGMGGMEEGPASRSERVRRGREARLNTEARPRSRTRAERVGQARAASGGRRGPRQRSAGEERGASPGAAREGPCRGPPPDLSAHPLAIWQAEGRPSPAPTPAPAPPAAPARPARLRPRRNPHHGMFRSLSPPQRGPWALLRSTAAGSASGSLRSVDGKRWRQPGRYQSPPCPPPNRSRTPPRNAGDGAPRGGANAVRRPAAGLARTAEEARSARAPPRGETPRAGVGGVLSPPS